MQYAFHSQLVGADEGETFWQVCQKSMCRIPLSDFLNDVLNCVPDIYRLDI